MSDEAKKLQVAIEATSNLPAVAGADTKAVKELKDETQRYQATLKGMADKDELSAQNERWQKINAAAKNYTDYVAQAKKELDDFTKQSDDSGKIEAKNSDITHGLELRKRELLEAIRGLTREYPILGEVARAAFNPMVASIFGVIEAVNIWQARMKFAQEILGAFELPDFTTHTAGVTAAAEAYDQLKTAVADANTEFNSATTIYERQAKAVEAQLAAAKLLIEAEKKKAEADLDVQKATGQITPEEYIERKAALEAKTDQEKEQAEANARANQLIAKRNEITSLGEQSAAEAAKAGKIQPGWNDEKFDDHISEVKQAVEDAKKAAEDARQNVKLAHAMQDMGNVEGLTLSGLGTEFKYDTTFGVATNPADAVKQAEQAQKAAEERQTSLETQARELAKQKEDRDKHTAEAAKLAGEQTTKAAEYKNETDPTVIGSIAWQQAQAAARAKVNAGAAASEADASIVNKFQSDAGTLTAFDKSTTYDSTSLEKARQTIQDMQQALKDHTALLSQIVSLKADLDALRQAQSVLKQQLNKTPQNSFSQ